MKPIVILVIIIIGIVILFMVFGPTEEEKNKWDPDKERTRPGIAGAEDWYRDRYDF